MTFHLSVVYTYLKTAHAFNAKILQWVFKKHRLKLGECVELRSNERNYVTIARVSKLQWQIKATFHKLLMSQVTQLIYVYSPSVYLTEHGTYLT